MKRVRRMGKKTYTVQWTPDITTTTGNGSISIGTPTGGGTDVSNLVPRLPRCSCCQFCPFTDGAIYTSLPAQVKCTLTDEFHFCDDTHCDVKEKVIPIEWVKNYLHELETISKDNLDLGEDGYFGEVVAIENMLSAWEKENDR